MPLQWRANYASAVAKDWRQQYDEFDGQGRDFIAWFNAPLSPELSRSEELIAACNLNPHNGEYIDFAAYLLCLGLPRESVKIGRYSGREYWHEDPFELPSHGLPSDMSPNVLISGAGDGGLQDLLRFAFGNKRPTQLIAAIDEEMQKDASDANAWSGFCNHIRIIASDGKSAPRIEGVKDPCAIFVKSLPPDCLQRIFHRIEKEIMFDFSKGFLQLICREPLLTASFALNRLLVRFLEAFLKNHLDVEEPLLRTGHGIAEIVGAGGHACANDPLKCHGKLHKCKIGSEAAEFNILVVRHGLLKDARILLESPPAPTIPAGPT